jgi:hypothetical protein
MKSIYVPYISISELLQDKKMLMAESDLNGRKRELHTLNSSEHESRVLPFAMT